MAKIEKLLAQAQPHLHAGEQVSAAVMGSYETRALGGDNARAGVMLATDQRGVFYAKKLGGCDLESFSYGNISSFEQSKTMMGYHVSFFAPGNKVTLKWIAERTSFEKFVDVFKSRMGHRSPAPVHDVPCTLLYGDDTLALSVAGKLKNLRARHWAEFADSLGLTQKAGGTANKLALHAATSISLEELPFSGSPLKGAQRELRHRRAEFSD